MRLRLRLMCLIPALACCGPGSCRNATPDVPFLRDAGRPLPTDAEPARADVETVGVQEFHPKSAELVKPPVNRTRIEGLDLEAPAGQVIVAALVYDLDNDGLRDAVTYVHQEAGGGGELRFHKGDAGGSLLPSRPVVGTQGGELAMPAPCVARPQPGLMTLVGPHSVALDVHPSCGEAAPTPRRFVVAGFGPVPTLRLSSRITEPAPGGYTLAVEVAASDRDGDGIDDPLVTFALEGGSAPWEPGDRLIAKVKFWDRPAGLARDRNDPESSFQGIGAQIQLKAKKASSAPQVASAVQRLRHLHAALCAEGGAPWIEVNGERGFACNASVGLEEGLSADVKAALLLDDPLGATAARERLATAPGVTRSARRNEVDVAITSAVPSVWGVTREVHAIPLTQSKGAPAWGALAFEPSGALLVRTVGCVARVEAAGVEADACEAASWPWEVTTTRDVALAAVVDSCNALHLSARLVGHDVPTGAQLVPLPLAAGWHRCASPVSMPSTPVTWTPEGLGLLVGQDRVIVPFEGQGLMGKRPTGSSFFEGAWVPGSPSSPGGRFAVVPTRFGLLRLSRRGDHAHVFIRARELEGIYNSLHECTVSDNGQRAACVREGKAVLFEVSPAPDGATTL